MDYFCKECASKPNWPWDDAKAFMHSCQRCFRHLPVNDYAWRKPQVVQSAAPKPKDLVPTQINVHSQVDLPKAKGVPQVPVPVYPVAPPPSSDGGPTEADRALDALQPNRPGIKLTAPASKGGKKLPELKEEPKFDLADDVKPS